jgi:hypothetical protein
MSASPDFDQITEAQSLQVVVMGYSSQTWKYLPLFQVPCYSHQNEP